MYFVDRAEVGRRPAHLKGQDVVVVGLPRGGVPVAAEVALPQAAVPARDWFSSRFTPVGTPAG